MRRFVLSTMNGFGIIHAKTLMELPTLRFLKAFGECGEGKFDSKDKIVDTDKNLL